MSLQVRLGGRTVGSLQPVGTEELGSALCGHGVARRVASAQRAGAGSAGGRGRHEALGRDAVPDRGAHAATDVRPHECAAEQSSGGPAGPSDARSLEAGFHSAGNAVRAVQRASPARVASADGTRRGGVGAPCADVAADGVLLLLDCDYFVNTQLIYAFLNMPSK